MAPGESGELSNHQVGQLALFIISTAQPNYIRSHCLCNIVTPCCKQGYRDRGVCVCVGGGGGGGYTWDEAQASRINVYFTACENHVHQSCVFLNTFWEPHSSKLWLFLDKFWEPRSSKLWLFLNTFWAPHSSKLWLFLTTFWKPHSSKLWLFLDKFWESQ